MKIMPKKLTTAEFIQRARTVHGARYDYSQAIYSSSTAKIEVLCPAHGGFMQSANSHLSGTGCPVCGADSRASKRKDGLAGFIAKAKAAHGESYDYSGVEYKGATSKVVIGCPVHGLFSQLAASHTNGSGCRKCAMAKVGQQNGLVLIDFIAKARAIHGALYDYSQAVYKNNREFILIICPKHGVFKQTPNTHLSGCGCRACGYEANSRNATLSHDEFLNKAKAVHGATYDYSRVAYKGGKRPILIACPKHGEFRQRPNAHLNGSSCPACANEKNWIEQAGGRQCELYLLRLFSNEEVFYKVGITSLSIQQRYKQASALGGVYQYEVLAVHKSANPERIYDWEQSILETFTHLSYKPKNHFPGASECFSSCEEILAIFPL